jgi:signal transduction histidine kinase
MQFLGTRTIQIVLSSLVAALYLPVILSAVRRREVQANAARLVVAYAGLAMLLQGLTTAFLLDLAPISPQDYLEVALFGMLILAILLALLVRAFLRLEGGLAWYVAGIAWPVIILLVATNAFGLPDVLWRNRSGVLLRDNLALGMLVVGWAAFVTGGIVLLLRAYRRRREPLYRNRMSYWAPIFLLLIASDMLGAYSGAEWGGALRLAGTALMGYVTLTHDVPDLREILRRSTMYIVTTLLAALLYAAGLFLAQALFPQLRGTDPLLLFVVIALLLALLFIPLLGLVRRAGNRIFRAEAPSATETLRHYSAGISNILDMERLSSVAVGLILDMLAISRGFLFLVDREVAPDDEVAYHVRAAVPEGDEPAPKAILSEQSPMVRALIQHRRPLLQYDIDLLPAYRETPSAERAWLAGLDTEVYVPIFSRQEWIGMFAFGPKVSGRRFTEEDLLVLSTLANQTAVAVENARLVENLVRLNSEIREAYAELDRANQSLEKIDRAKTDFISIASHELRTPLTVLRGYAGMLIEAPSIQEQEPLLKWVTGINESTLRMHEIMESMFDMVQIDNRTMQMHMQAVDLNEMIDSVAARLRRVTEERNQTLSVELPSLESIEADPNVLEKVFDNLLRNAVKFTPDGGKIDVTARELAPTGPDLPEGGVEVIISDTGVGVAPENHDVIFTKFFQSGDLERHSSGKTKFKGAGAGLGLALSRGIVEAHGGRIWVESPGYDEENFPGSQFHVLLPRRPQAPIRAMPPPVTDDSGDTSSLAP